MEFYPLTNIQIFQCDQLLRLAIIIIIPITVVGSFITIVNLFFCRGAMAAILFIGLEPLAYAIDGADSHIRGGSFTLC